MQYCSLAAAWLSGVLKKETFGIPKLAVHQHVCATAWCQQEELATGSCCC